MNGWIDVPNCPVCGADNRVKYATVTTVPNVETSLGFISIQATTVIHYVQCVMCGMIWQTPRMDDVSLGVYYSGGYYRQWLGLDQDAIDADERLRSTRILDEIKKLNAKLKSKFTSHLDIGCSRGYLLDMTRDELGFSVWGVESNVPYVTEEIPVASKLELIKRKFDLITMIHVLEHTTDPVKELINLWPYLTDGGTLMIEVPSQNSKGGPMRLAHTLYMQPWVLVNICHRAGYMVREVSLKEHTLLIADK